MMQLIWQRSLAAFVIATSVFLYAPPLFAQGEGSEAELNELQADFAMRFVQYLGGEYFSGFIADYLSSLAPRRAQGCRAPTGMAIAPNGIVIVADPNENGEYEFDFSDDGRPLNLMWMVNLGVDYCGTQVAEEFIFHSSVRGALSVRDSSLGMPYTDARRPEAMAERERQIEELRALSNPRRDPLAADVDVEHSYPGDEDDRD